MNGGADQIRAVVAPVEAEGLAEAGRAGAEIDGTQRFVGTPAAGRVARPTHDAVARQRCGGAQQDGGADAVLAADDVGAVVHAVREVDVEMSRRPEHRPVAVSHPAVAVAGWVGGALVGLDLDDPRGAPAADEDLVQEPRRYFERRGRVERAG